MTSTMTGTDARRLILAGEAPDGLSVGGDLDLSGCTGLAALHVDGRDYRLVRIGAHYHAGCRKFTARQAIRHWGSPAYPDAERGAAFVAAVRRAERDRTVGEEVDRALDGKGGVP